MRNRPQALKELPPETIVRADDPSQNAPRRGERLFEKVGDKTAELVADGCVLVASLWESAWTAGGGERVPKARIQEIDEKTLSRLVRSDGFVPSMTIEEMAGVLG